MLKPNKKDLSQPVTLGDFIEFTDFATNTFATKEDLHNEITGVKQEMRGMKLDIAGIKSEVSGMKSDIAGIKSEVSGMKSDIAGIKSEVSGMKDEMMSMKDEILTSNEKLLHEVQTMRQEQAAHSINHRDITNDIQDLKHRMKRVEAHAGLSHA